MVTFAAGRHMPAKRLRSAGRDGGHHSDLLQRDMARIGPPPRRAMVSKNICDLKLAARQRPRPLLQTSLQSLILQVREHFKWADRVFDRLGRDMGVLGRG